MKPFLSTRLLLSPVTIFALMTFLSCGHQQTAGEEELFSGVEGQEEVASGDSDSKDLSNVADASDVEAAAAEDATLEPTDSEKESTAAAPEAEEKSEDTLTAADTTDKPSSPDLLTTSESEGPAPEQTQAFETPAEPEQTVAEVKDTTEPTLVGPEATPVAEAAPTTPATEPTFEAPANEAAPATVAEENPAPAKQRKVASPSVGPAKTPKIPTGTVTRKGQALNRYYFLRTGDTPISTSQLIYGNTDRSNDLIAWNGSEWKAGKLVYFVSPENATDSEMKSLYVERGIAAEEYTVQSGDWLSKIAVTAYGNSNSWKEIAVLNGMESPDAIEPGSKISLYPAKLPEKVAKNEAPAPATSLPPEATPTVAAVTAAPAAAPVVATPENKVPPQDTASVVADAEPLTDEDELLPPPPAPVANKEPLAVADKSLQKKGSAELASPEVGSFFEKHMIAVIAALAVVFGAVFALRRYKKSREFME